MKRLLIFLIFLFFCFHLKAQIKFTDPGFEGPPEYTPPPFWDTCSVTPDTDPIQGYPSYYLQAFEGKTYLGLGSDKMSKNPNESAGQKLECSLLMNKVHQLSLALYQVKDGSPYPITIPIHCQIWAGYSLCEQGQLLWESPELGSKWNTYNVSFIPNQSYTYILFTSFICDTCGNNLSGGYIGVDALSDITVEGYNFLSTSITDTIVKKDSCITIYASSDDTTTVFQWSSIPAGFSTSSSSITYCPSSDIKFVCTATYGCGGQNSDTVNVAVIPDGVPIVNRKSFFSIYPNPTQDELNISMLNNSHAKQITITDALGRVVMQVVPQKQMQVNIQLLVPGIYFIKVQMSDGNIEVRKFVKE